MTHGANRRVDSDASRLDHSRTLGVYALQAPAEISANTQHFNHQLFRDADLGRLDRHYHAIRGVGAVMSADVIERDMIREAIATATATETVGKKLGAKLI